MQHKCQSTFCLCVPGEDRCGREAKANNGENKGAGYKAATHCGCRHRLTDQERCWCTRLDGRNKLWKKLQTSTLPDAEVEGSVGVRRDVEMDGAVISSLVSINRSQHLHHLRKWDRRKMEREKQNKGQSQTVERRRERKNNGERKDSLKKKKNNLMHILISDISINLASTFANRWLETD